MIAKRRYIRTVCIPYSPNSGNTVPHIAYANPRAAKHTRRAVRLDTMSDTPCIRVADLHKHFGTLDVLKGVSFEVHRGSVVSMIGASGSGKSTLLRCINHLE